MGLSPRPSSQIAQRPRVAAVAGVWPRSLVETRTSDSGRNLFAAHVSCASRIRNHSRSKSGCILPNPSDVAPGKQPGAILLSVGDAADIFTTMVCQRSRTALRCGWQSRHRRRCAMTGRQAMIGSAIEGSSLICVYDETRKAARTGFVHQMGL
jgi:hypothetical protein